MIEYICGTGFGFLVQLIELESTLAGVTIWKSENGTLHPLLHSCTGQINPPSAVVTEC